ncbi:MAG: hypothetical protein NTX00_02690 [Candidatus Parcubacteria bacterium]|nr:hypothetical protein [Candidatus Parcubacteria bacterium]
MPIDLLQSKKPIKIKREKLPDELSLHKPGKEKLAAIEKAKIKKEIKKEEPQKVVPKKEILPYVNFISAFKIYILKKRLTFTLILVIIILAVFGTGLYFFYFYKPQPKVVLNVNKPGVNLNIPPSPLPVEQPKEFCGDGICQANEDYNTCPLDCPAPPPPPPVEQPKEFCGDGICQANENYIICSLDCQPPPPPIPQPLPNTELAPLRGALVRFSGSADIYLIENNGELRKIDQKTVAFANGQTISKINPNLIYLLAVGFADIRQGKDVIGKISWDPRVLSQPELEPYQK